jgi:predicted RNA polymerase sigma factor
MPVCPLWLDRSAALGSGLTALNATDTGNAANAPDPSAHAAPAPAAAVAVAVASRAARDSYGRLLALLASRSGDLAGAQDALAEAFASALETWPQRGVPSNPEAWLLTVARNRQSDVWHSAAARTSVPLDAEEIEDMLISDVDLDAIPDQRMKLLFVCAHPAIDAAMRAPLMLQTVLGIDADVIARAFLVPAAAMAQRLVRVKRKIKDALIPFVMPSQSDMAERLESVLEAIYGAFAIAWDTPAQAPPQHGDAQDADNNLTDEARFLADLLVQLLPDDAEVLGLAACIALSNARSAARVSAEGAYVPLESQDTTRWDARQIAWGEHLLQRAQALGAMGRFQLEAAIESVHTHRAQSGVTDWSALALLYEGLMRFAPGIGTAVGRAIAVGHSQTPAAGLAALDVIEHRVRENYQPAWAARAHLLTMDGQVAAAVVALDRAMALAPNERVRQDLAQRRSGLLMRAGGHTGGSRAPDLRP